MKPKSLLPDGRKDPTYISWSRMKQRCRRCLTWMEDKRWNSFDAFFADMGTRPEGTTIDRIDNARGYCKENCRWATSRMQQNNRTNNIMLTYKGDTLSAEVWARRLGITGVAMRARVRKLGSTTNPALFTPKAPGKGHELENR